VNENDTFEAAEGGSALVSLGGLADLAYEVTKTAGSPLGAAAGATATATMVNDDSSCNNDTVTPVATNSSGISQTGVVVDGESQPGCSLTVVGSQSCPGVLAADDGKQVWAASGLLPSNAYVYGANSASHAFTLSASPVASVPLTSTATTVVFYGETYNVTVTDPYNTTQTATVGLMVNPNGVIKWTAQPAGTFSQYPLTGTAVTIPVP
jgi:hypothetical protein